MTQKYIQQIHILGEDGETLEQHAEFQRDEAAIVDRDRASKDPRTGGLFKGRFNKPHVTHIGPIIHDAEDGVARCPSCTWEITSDEDFCQQCGHPFDTDYNSESDSDYDPESEMEMRRLHPATWDDFEDIDDGAYDGDGMEDVEDDFRDIAQLDNRAADYAWRHRGDPPVVDLTTDEESETHSAVMRRASGYQSSRSIDEEDDDEEDEDEGDSTMSGFVVDDEEEQEDGGSSESSASTPRQPSTTRRQKGHRRGQTRVVSSDSGEEGSSSASGEDSEDEEPISSGMTRRLANILTVQHDAMRHQSTDSDLSDEDSDEADFSESEDGRQSSLDDSNDGIEATDVDGDTEYDSSSDERDEDAE